MSGVTPVAVYALRVPANGALIPAVPEFSAMFRVSMAAIDPDEAPEYEDGFDSNKRPRATLKLFDLKAAISKLIKGKAPANDDEESDDESDEGLELDETVICTLDPEKNCQQPLDIVVNEEEPVFFKVTGTHTIYLTGNYDELDMEDLIGEDDESDDLDDLENPRITEVDSEEEEAPKLAAPVEEKKEAKEGKEAKKVQFAKNLEQGPTGSTQQKPAEKTTGTLGVKEVKGVKIDDKKLGQGVAAKAGNTVAMRYIGKLEDGKVFDANKKGKPFTFKLGKGEVIKGWDIGVAGMAVGGERRISIPPHLAYGKRALPGIPANSKLIFDVKLLEIK
ncbi:Apolipoprotein O family protein [Aspergillus niger]|uniref:peptidylprolyl isomerase n=1 Tax=Aspergillus niger TaxID=5061 RepID=A0A505I9F3_ASPNG|nr:Apolipoprotein O family protein [Aspergillus niger]